MENDWFISKCLKHLRRKVQTKMQFWILIIYNARFILFYNLVSRVFLGERRYFYICFWDTAQSKLWWKRVKTIDVVEMCLLSHSNASSNSCKCNFSSTRQRTTTISSATDIIVIVVLMAVWEILWSIVIVHYIQIVNDYGFLSILLIFSAIGESFSVQLQLKKYPWQHNKQGGWLAGRKGNQFETISKEEKANYILKLWKNLSYFSAIMAKIKCSICSNQFNRWLYENLSYLMIKHIFRRGF